MLKKLLIRNLILLIPFQFAGAQIGTDIVDWESFLSQHDMVWDTIPPDYYGGAISGNGLLGTNVYADTLPATYRFDIGRSDVTEMRTGGETLYNGARLPIGYFTLTTSTPALSEEMRVHLHTATTTGKITTKQGTISFESFVDANENMIVIETTATGNETDYEWQWNPGKAISPRTSFSYTHQSTPPEYLAHANPEPEISQKGGYKLCVQNLYSGYTYVTAWKEERQAGRRLFYITVSFEKGTSAAISSALATLDSYQSRSLKERKQKHDEWWANYYPASFAHFADKKIESFYWIQQYKFACLTRSGKNIIDLMGPWTTRTPWPAIWLNLNIQLTYSPLFTANRLELTEPVWESLHKNIESLSRNVPVKEWQQDAIAIGRSSSYDLVSPLRMDLAEQNQYEVGNLTWLLFYYCQYCTYKNDDDELLNRFYPLLKKSIAYYSHIIYIGDDGKYHLPMTASPEYKPAEDCNYDLSLLKWGLKTLLEIDRKFILKDPDMYHWVDVMDNLTDYPTDSNEGYIIGKDVKLTSSHRHYSHLLMIYPLRLITPDTQGNREMIEKSLKHWIGQKGALQGYSYTGASSISSMLGHGEDAYIFIRDLLNNYIQPNTLYKETGPVIETPLSAVTSLQEMYLQSMADTVRVFHAVPAQWEKASFIDFRAEKGVLVSAIRNQGKTSFVQLKSPIATSYTVLSDFEKGTLSVRGKADGKTEYTKKFRYNNGALTLNLSAGETVTIKSNSFKESDAYYNYHEDDFSYGVKRNITK